MKSVDEHVCTSMQSRASRQVAEWVHMELSEEIWWGVSGEVDEFVVAIGDCVWNSLGHHEAG